jgi:murein DD-endopeptidase MepM/ murein hydrolase activator NlpD
MSLLDRAIDYSLKKGYLKSSEVNSVRTAIQGIVRKYGLPEEWFVKTILIEAEGFYASKVAKNSCAGIFQFCSWGTVVKGGGLKREGYTLSQVANLSPVEQTRLWDTYHLQVWLKQAARKPQSAAELYVINLFPKAFLEASKGKLGVNTPIRTVQPSAWGNQAMILYSDYNPATRRSPRLNRGNSEVTLASIERGLNLKIEELFKESSSTFTDTIVNAANQVGSLAQDAASVISNGLATLNSGIQSALLTGQNCPPPPYTQQDRITYPGCLQKTANPIFGNGLGSGTSAPGVNAINNQSQDSNQNQSANNQAADNSEPYKGELKPGGMICPVKGARISSPYGWRIHPIKRTRRFHNGIDFAVPTGTPVLAVADGIVRFAKWEGGYGNSVVIDHPQLGAATRYAHNSRNAVSAGQRVKQGQVIAYVGSTGDSTGPHSHVEILLGGNRSTDPAKYIKC